MKEKAMTYKNPLPFSDGKEHTNPDPYILRWCGDYYCYATDEKGVKVSVSKDLILWESRGYALEDAAFHDYWAPSVWYENGVFYLYYSNVEEGEEDCHQELLKLAVSRNPLGPFEYQKTFFEEFSIDSHPVFWNGQLSLLYSVNNWIGTEEKMAGTCILQDRMLRPDVMEGEPKAVLLPSLPQEIYEADRFGDGRDWYTIEGACILRHGRYCWLLYSANAYEHEDYFVGTAVAGNRKDFRDMDFRKYPSADQWEPLLKKNAEAEGTGHNTVTKAPNMVDDWIVYHGRDAREELILGKEQRTMRMDALYYDGRKLLCAGPSCGETKGPCGPQQSLRNLTVTESVEVKGAAFYHMELWISAVRQHTGARFGVFLAYLDEENHVELQVSSGSRSFGIWQCRDGIRIRLGEGRLPAGFDYTSPHLITAERREDHFLALLDEKEMLDVRAEPMTGEGKVRIVPYFSQMKLHSLDLTEHAYLAGEELIYLTAFYEVRRAYADETGLYHPYKETELLLKKGSRDRYWREEFSLEVEGTKNRLCIFLDGACILECCLPVGETTMYLVKEEEREGILQGGVFTDAEGLNGGKLRIVLNHVKLTEFYHTKI